MKWKVCGMKNPHNIEQVLSLVPDYMGFIFYKKSPRYVGANWEGPLKIAPPTKTVGVFVNEALTSIKILADRYHLDLLQLHGDETPGYCQDLSKKGYDLIKAIPIENRQDLQQLEAFKPWVKYFLFDTKSPNYGGTGKAFDWSILKYYDNELPLVLSGGISLEMLPRITCWKDLNLAFIDVNSQFEDKPGLKNVQLLTTLKKKIQQL